MTQFVIHYAPGATPLDPDEQADLIPNYITTRGELDVLEQKNIQDALLWLKNQSIPEVLDTGFVYELHKRMFCDVWKWAGRSRKSEKNIGVDWTQIGTRLAELMADAKSWIQYNTYSKDEVATRFHHRLIQIHVFPNGNGRHARLMTDLLREQMGDDAFSWGLKTIRSSIETEGPCRQNYIAALQAADKNDFAPLMNFVKS